MSSIQNLGLQGLIIMDIRTDIEKLEKAVKERGLLWKNLNST